MSKKILSSCTPCYQRKHTRESGAGFTLIELLVVIAIIGILSSIAIINLNSARNRAKTAAAKKSLSAVVTAGYLCQANNWNINCEWNDPADSFPTATTTSCGNVGTPILGTKICASNDPANNIGIWPDITQYNWRYRPVNAYSSTTNHTFSFIADDDNNGAQYTCNEAGCQ